MSESDARHRAPREPARPGRTLMATMPVLLVGSLALSTIGLAPTVEHAGPSHRDRTDASGPKLGRATITSTSSATVAAPSAQLSTESVAPTSYTVRRGDTVSEIAARYGLSTPSVLALNGLGWKSLIFPGQVLRLTSAVTAVAPAAPAVAVTPTAPAPSTTSGTYVIQRGDTITSIAKKMGVSISAILTANTLTAASIIYAGRTLTIPGSSVTTASTGTPAVEVALVGAVTKPLSPSMAANAKTIISVGRSLGVSDFGLVVALATAAQESGLQNLSYGDRDSVGLFQQRPSTGWGTVSQLTNPTYAAELFFGGPHNPNKGRTRGLLDIRGWQSMSVTQAAQAVQISGAPTAYAKWEASARAWLAQVG